MNLPIKLISTDFDGTIFAEFENPPIADEFVELIGQLQAQGAKWIVNTGRDLSGLMEALARARLPIQPDGLVLVEREIYFHKDSRYVGLEEWNHACTRDHEQLFHRIRADLPRIAKWINARFTATIYEDSYSPFCLLAGNNGEADEIHAYLEEYCRSVPHLQVVRNDAYARLAHSGYDKGRGLAEIARRWHISRDHIFAAGDHLNDLPMLDPVHARWLATNANAMPMVKVQIQKHGGFISRRAHARGIVDALEAFLAAT